MANIARALRNLTEWKLQQPAKYPNNSWFWRFLEEYRDAQGRTLEEAELANAFEIFQSETERKKAIAARRWTWSPKSEKEVTYLTTLLEAFFHPDETFTYLEFGTCFGTTLTRVLGHFKNACGIGLEINPTRSDVTRWLISRMDATWNLSQRVKLFKGSIVDVSLEPKSVDVVFMDTNHVYPDEFEYITYILKSNLLRDGFVFVGDDPLHTGSDTTRRRFIAEQSRNYRIITREDKNLWWFSARQTSSIL